MVWLILHSHVVLRLAALYQFPYHDLHSLLAHSFALNDAFSRVYMLQLDLTITVTVEWFDGVQWG